jgi:pilus assembly protein Flp/PilA
MKIIKRFAKDESGATAIEYGLIAAIVGVGIIVGLTAVKDGLNTLFNGVSDTLTTQTPAGS